MERNLEARAGGDRPTHRAEIKTQSPKRRLDPGAVRREGFLLAERPPPDALVFLPLLRITRHVVLRRHLIRLNTMLRPGNLLRNSEVVTREDRARLPSTSLTGALRVTSFHGKGRFAGHSASRPGPRHMARAAHTRSCENPLPSSSSSALVGRPHQPHTPSTSNVQRV